MTASELYSTWSTTDTVSITGWIKDITTKNKSLSFAHLYDGTTSIGRMIQLVFHDYDQDIISQLRSDVTVTVTAKVIPSLAKGQDFELDGGKLIER